jgi:TolB-like protein
LGGNPPRVNQQSRWYETAPRLLIVVLPLENLSGDKEQDYFADGITDDLDRSLAPA